MPFALIIVGAVLLISSTRNTLTNTQNTGLYQLLASDFTGSDNFIFWAVSILIIGAIGYIPKLKPISVAFMTLVILVLFLKKGTGVFSQFESAIASTQTANPNITGAPPPGGYTTGSSSPGAVGANVLSDLSIEGPTPISSSPVIGTVGTTGPNFPVGTTGPNLPDSSSTDESYNPLGLDTFAGFGMG
jgi:hypothetical protein